jgi:hypothetical protein
LSFPADVETLLIANRDDIDLALVRREWSAVAAGEEARTAWLEDAIARFVPPPRLRAGGQSSKPH